MVIQRSSQHGHEGGEQVEAALPRLDALVLQLLVQDLDDGGDLGVQESERTVGERGGRGGGRGEGSEGESEGSSGECVTTYQRVPLVPRRPRPGLMLS